MMYSLFEIVQSLRTRSRIDCFPVFFYYCRYTARLKGEQLKNNINVLSFNFTSKLKEATGGREKKAK